MKKAESRRIDAFELWYWRRLLRVPWPLRRSNQSILKEISLGCSLEGMMLKLKLQSFATSCEELTHWKRLWCWEGLGAGGEGDDSRWDGWMASLTRWTWVWVNSGVGDGQGGLACCDSWGCKESDMTEWLNWTEKMVLLKCYTQYASKFGKLSSSHRTRKGQFSFQSQRKAMPKNAQATAQLQSSHTLAM